MSLYVSSLVPGWNIPGLTVQRYSWDLGFTVTPLVPCFLLNTSNLKPHGCKNWTWDATSIRIPLGGLTFAAVPAETAGHVGGLDGALLAGLQQDEQPLQLVRDAGHGVLLGLLELPAG